MTRILVTGGAGFIGTALTRRLVTAGDEVVIADTLHPQVHPTRALDPSLYAPASFVPFDVTHPDPWVPLLRSVRPDTVVHLAAETGTGQSLSEASRHGLVNVVGTTRLLDALYALDERPNHIVLTSSRAVYGDGAWSSADGSTSYPGLRRLGALRAALWDHVGPSGERLAPIASIAGVTEANPTNVYAATKLAQEHILRSWCAATETRLSILRLQNVYGPGQAISNAYTGVLTFFARQVLGGERISVFEDGDIIRDFVYIDDVISALAAAIKSPPVTERCLDIGSGVASTILEVANAMAAAGDAPEPAVSGEFREGDVRAAFCSIEAAREQIGYQPSTMVGEGIRSLLAWVGDQSA